MACDNLIAKVNFIPAYFSRFYKQSFILKFLLTSKHEMNIFIFSRRGEPL